MTPSEGAETLARFSTLGAEAAILRVGGGKPVPGIRDDGLTRKSGRAHEGASAFPRRPPRLRCAESRVQPCQASRLASPHKFRLYRTKAPKSSRNHPEDGMARRDDPAQISDRRPPATTPPVQTSCQRMQKRWNPHNLKGYNPTARNRFPTNHTQELEGKRPP